MKPKYEKSINYCLFSIGNADSILLEGCNDG